MATAQNNKSVNTFPDDLDSIFDGIDPESYSENLTDDSDEFDRLLSNKIAGKSALKKEMTEVGVNKMVTDMERPGPKLVTRDLDALLDSIADDDHSRPEMRSATANKQAEPLKNTAFNQFDDFEDFDEFGEVGAMGDAKMAGFPPTSKSAPASVPETMMDLEEAFGVKFKPMMSKMDSDFAALDDEPDIDPGFAKAKMNRLGVADNAFSTDKNVPKATPAVQLSAVAKTALKPAATLDYELLDDEFEEMSESHSVADTINIEQPTTLLAETGQAEDDSLFKAMDDDFVAVNFDQAEAEIIAAVPKTQAAAFKVDKPMQNSGFNEIDDFGDDVDTQMATPAVEQPVAVAIPPTPMAEATAHPAQDTQINELWAAHRLVKQQMDDFIQQKEQPLQADKMEGLDRLSNERKERKLIQELVESKGKKLTRLAYMAAGASLLSLMMGGGILAFGWGPLSQINELKAHTALIDQDLAALKAGGAPSIAVQGSHDGSGPMVTQLTEQVKKIQALLVNDKAVGAHGFRPNTDLAGNEAQPSKPALKDIQTKEDKSIRVVATDEKEATPAKKLAQPSAWVANLISVRQEWYAKQKAAEFAGQGVPTVVVPVNVNGQSIYILRSNNFPTQDQATAYAAKAKKALNLTTILVSPDE